MQFIAPVHFKSIVSILKAETFTDVFNASSLKSALGCFADAKNHVTAAIRVWADNIPLEESLSLEE